MKAPWFSRGVQPNSTTIAVALAVLAASPSGSTAQFTSGVNAVEVYAAVVDRQGQPVTGLTVDSFEVRENGEIQTISTFAEADFPLAVAIALDRSFSMAGERLAVAKSAARAFLGELRPEDQSMLIGVGSTIEVIVPLSTDRPRQFAALSGIDAFGTTGLYDAIVNAIESIQSARGRRALVLLSDGNDRYSTAKAADALERARRSDVIVYPVAIGRTNAPVFAELAALTGGRSFHVRDPKTLASTLQSIARELRHQYLLGYTPSRPITPGHEEWRSIVVGVKKPDVRVRARDGYLVK